MKTLDSFSTLTDSDLLSAVRAAAQRERTSTAELVALLAHVDSRRLYLGQGYSSLFTFCTQALHLSEHAAYGRIEAARAGRRLPRLLDLLAEGAVTLTTVTLLAPHLTSENHADVLREARHKNKREVEHIVARLRPQPNVSSTVRKLPVAPVARWQPDENRGTVGQPAPAAVVPTVTHRPMPRPNSAVTPTAPERYKVQFTAV